MKWKSVYYYPFLEKEPLLDGECVSLGDDGDHVHHLVQSLHELYIQGLQSGGGGGERKSAHAWQWTY